MLHGVNTGFGDAEARRYRFRSLTSARASISCIDSERSLLRVTRSGCFIAVLVIMFIGNYSVASSEASCPSSFVPIICVI